MLQYIVLLVDEKYRGLGLSDELIKHVMNNKHEDIFLLVFMSLKTHTYWKNRNFKPIVKLNDGPNTEEYILYYKKK